METLISFGEALYDYRDVVLNVAGLLVAAYAVIGPARQFVKQRGDQIQNQLEADLARIMNSLGIVNNSLWALSRSDMLVTDTSDPWTWNLANFDLRLADADAAYARAIDMVRDAPLDYALPALRIINDFGMAIAHGRDARGYLSWLASDRKHQNDQMREGGRNVWAMMKQRLGNLGQALLLAQEDIQGRVDARARREGLRPGHRRPRVD
jgi:hypothetical protein